MLTLTEEARRPWLGGWTADRGPGGPAFPTGPWIHSVAAFWGSPSWLNHTV